MWPKLAAAFLMTLGVLIVAHWRGLTINGKTIGKLSLLLAILSLIQFYSPPETILSEFLADLLILTAVTVGTSAFLFLKW